MSQDSQTHRYLAALPTGGGEVFLAWRLLPTDGAETGFHVERRARPGSAWERVTDEAVVDSTNCIDRPGVARRYEYRVVAADHVVSEMAEVDSGAEASKRWLDVELDPDDDVQGIIIGDLRNDGRMGYVLRVIREGTVWIVAYSHVGEPLWRTDTGLPAAGGWDGSTQHVPFLCWDINADGRTEVVFHGHDERFPGEFYEEGGPGEHMAAVDGETGELVWRTSWPATKARVLMTVGHLRGMDRAASIVVQDETYGDLMLTSIYGQDGGIHWRVPQPRPGGHNLDIGDIDGDGVQEVICGGVCYDGDGTVRWEAEPFGHTDISKPAKIDRSREGMQIWYAVESHNPGVYLVDQHGETIFKEPFRHAHYGWIARHAPGVAGLQPHTAEDARHEYGAEGAGMREDGHFPIFLPDGSHWLNLTDWQRKNLVPVHWDESREVVFAVRKENKRIVRLLPTGEIDDLPDAKLPEGGEYGRNLACADIVGDFRENIVTLDRERNRLMVLVNTDLATRRALSPFESFQYRHDRSQHGSGYYVYLSPPEDD